MVVLLNSRSCQEVKRYQLLSDSRDTSHTWLLTDAQQNSTFVFEK